MSHKIFRSFASFVVGLVISLAGFSPVLGMGPVSIPVDRNNIASVPMIKPDMKSLTYIPQVSISAPPNPVGIRSMETKLLTYSLKEMGNVSGEITSRTYQFYTQYDVALSEPMGPFPTSVSVNSLQTTNWNELVYLPEGVANKARSLEDYAIVLKTTFEGSSLSGAKFSAQASLLLLLPPATFSKDSPANGAVVPPTNQSLKWNSSIGAIDYEYCFDSIDNNSCDTDWTGTYWLGTYDTNAALQDLPPGTTFHWQVRANNMAGQTYANNGNWWSFTTVLEVTIDIRPGRQSSPINSKSSGKIPIAILSTQDFDAPTKVDKASLTFGRTGDEVSLAFCSKKGVDVNRDGLLDLVCHFQTNLTGFQIGDTKGILKGQTVNGIPIEGQDTVRILK